MEQAMDGIDELEQYVDALLIIKNDKLKDIYGDLKLSEAFAMADNVLTIAAKSIAEIITVKGYVNVDFADVDGVMRNSGVALMGAAEAEGENRAMQALEEALISPLLNSHDIRGASNILLNILYGEQEVTMDEITLITENLQERVGGNVNVIWGAGKDDTLGNKFTGSCHSRWVLTATAVWVHLICPAVRLRERGFRKPYSRWKKCRKNWR